MQRVVSPVQKQKKEELRQTESITVIYSNNIDSLREKQTRRQMNMKKKLFTILTVMLVTMLTSSTTFAAGGLKFRDLDFSKGSLIAKGEISGLGNTDVTMVLEAIADDPEFPPQISCINNGTNFVPGQSSPKKIKAIGEQNLAGDDDLRKNGRSPFFTETSDFIPWDVAGCPSSNWVGHLDDAFWTKGTIVVYPGLNIDLNNPPPALLIQPFVCYPREQTATTVSCELQ